MEIQKAGNRLIKERYNLHNASEVRTAAKFKRARTGEKVPQDPNSQIQNYLDRMQEIFSLDFEDPEGRDALKTRILDRYTTHFQDIPESFWKGQEKILRERGQLGDYNRYSDEQRDQWKEEIAEGQLKDQKASLEQWVDYFASSDSSYIPPALKYWVFRNVVKLSEFDKEKGEFPERSKGTLKMFPDINPEALAYVNDAVIKKLKGENMDFGNFEFDLTQEQKSAFQEALKRENFPKLYAWANEQIAPIPAHLLPVTSGTWVKYDQGSDFQRFVSSVKGKGTGWCIAADSTAQSYLRGGDFYTYYSNDENGNPTIPRLAIRMEEGRIAEVRGIDYKQNVDPYMPEVLAEKLEEFPDKAAYLKKAADMERLTEVDNRVQAGLPLSASDLTFLYELDFQIEGFGYSRDPRIEEIRSQRNQEEDMAIVFDCDPSQIAHSPSDINEDTKAFVGKLESGIFDAIRQHNIEHVYTSFPEGKICFDMVTIGGRTKEELEKELADSNINISSFAQGVLRNPDLTPLPEGEDLRTVKLRVEDLGFDTYATTGQLYNRAKELGLELCPAEAGPYMRLKDLNQPMNDWYYIAMKQIADSFGNPNVFSLERSGDGFWLSDSWAEPDSEWNSDRRFVFGLRK